MLWTAQLRQLSWLTAFAPVLDSTRCQRLQPRPAFRAVQVCPQTSQRTPIRRILDRLAHRAEEGRAPPPCPFSALRPGAFPSSPAARGPKEWPLAAIDCPGLTSEARLRRLSHHCCPRPFAREIKPPISYLVGAYAPQAGVGRTRQAGSNEEIATSTMRVAITD